MSLDASGIAVAISAQLFSFLSSCVVPLLPYTCVVPLLPYTSYSQAPNAWALTFTPGWLLSRL